MISESRTTHVDSSFNVLSLFAGIGGLDLSVRIAIPNARTIAFVEREAPAIGFLVEAMEAGILDTAPIWTDVTTFDGLALRGKVDCIIAGAPCQPYSVAGSRKGDADERYLWPAIFRIIDDVQPAMVLLENVPGLLVWFRPIGEELCRMGYRLEIGLFSASECGAPQKRERLFILAHALRAGSSSELAIQPNKEHRADSAGTSSGSVDDARRSERRPDSHRSGDSGEGFDRGREKASRIAESSEGVADAENDQRRSEFEEGGERCGRSGLAGDSSKVSGVHMSDRMRLSESGHDAGRDQQPMSDSQSLSKGGRGMSSARRAISGNDPEGGYAPLAHASDTRLQGRELGTTRNDNGGGQETHGSTTEFRRARLPLWPPGPGDAEGWRHVLERWPELAPAVADSDSWRLEAIGSSELLDGETARGHDADGCDTEELEDPSRLREYGQDREDGGSSGRNGETGGELADASIRGLRADRRPPGDGGHSDERCTPADRQEEIEPAVRGLADGARSFLSGVTNANRKSKTSGSKTGPKADSGNEVRTVRQDYRQIRTPSSGSFEAAGSGSSLHKLSPQGRSGIGEYSNGDHPIRELSNMRSSIRGRTKSARHCLWLVRMQAHLRHLLGEPEMDESEQSEVLRNLWSRVSIQEAERADVLSIVRHEAALEIQKGEAVISRTDQLRGLGNAVVPICGALALRTLMQRAGLIARDFGQD